jgi:hypothetical protein
MELDRRGHSSTSIRTVRCSLIAVLSVAVLVLLGGSLRSGDRVDGASADPSLPAALASAAGSDPDQAANGKMGRATTPADSLVDFDLIRGVPGFWRIGRTRDGVWWFISPDNRREWLNTVTTVQPFQLGRRAGGPHFLSRDWDGGFDMTSGDVTRWAEATLARVKAAGFKGLGAWCHPIFHTLDVPITRDLNIWAHATGGDRFLYSPGWLEVAERAVARQVTPLAENRNLVGYYTDNELDWGDSGSGPGIYFDYLKPDDPNRQKVIEVIRRLWPDIDTFNAAWRMSIKDWDELSALDVLPHEPAEAYQLLFEAWLEQLATDYFRLTTMLIRKYDANHLILGVRFKGHAPDAVVRGHRGHTDAVSINYYVADAKLDPDMWPAMYRESEQPIIVTEYAFHALDGRSGNRNTFGFAAQVLDQQARADGYQVFTQRLARLPYVIGADWFQWSDEPPSGRTADGEDVNFGIVDIDDRPYELLLDAIRATAPTLNDLHASSSQDARYDVFRESFERTPTFEIPRRTWSLRINGEISDWPNEAKLPGIRPGQTLGLDRSPLPVPDVYAAWDERGVYFGVVMYDRDIAGAPADGWWWTRDNFEIFLSTRSPVEGQNFYTPHDHQFFFVPIAFPGPDGQSGVVGQWKRPGDSISQNLIPHPRIEEASRVFPERYVAEMFIPAEALHGFDPTGRTPMAFNFQARNFQSALDYFWSAPKGVNSQLRPGTWGKLMPVGSLEPIPEPDSISSQAR